MLITLPFFFRRCRFFTQRREINIICRIDGMMMLLYADMLLMSCCRLLLMPPLLIRYATFFVYAENARGGTRGLQ